MIEWTGKPSNEEPCHFWDPLSKDLDSWTSDAAAKFLSPLNPAYPNRSFLISQVPQEFISSKNSKSWNVFASTNRLLFPGSPLRSIPRLTFLDFPTYTRIYIYIHTYIYIYYVYIDPCLTVVTLERKENISIGLCLIFGMLIASVAQIEPCPAKGWSLHLARPEVGECPGLAGEKGRCPKSGSVARAL